MTYPVVTYPVIAYPPYYIFLAAYVLILVTLFLLQMPPFRIFS